MMTIIYTSYTVYIYVYRYITNICIYIYCIYIVHGQTKIRLSRLQVSQGYDWGPHSIVKYAVE